MNAAAISQPMDLSLDADALDFSPQPAVRSRQPLSDPRPAVKKATASAQSPSAAPMSLSLLLRGLGGLVIVAAFVLYLFHGWRDTDDLTRCLLLLGHTLALTLAGFASGHWLHEGKGARLFIALALAAVPVNFAFLGGLTYPLFTWDVTGSLSQASSIWTRFDGSLAGGSVLLLSAGSLLVLALAMWIGFRVMARHSASRLTGLYLLSNAALLVPTRGDLAVSALLLGFASGLAAVVPALRRRDAALATPEGAFARAVLLLPLVILAGRSLWLYSPEGVFYTTMSLLLYLGLRWVLARLPSSAGWRVPLESLTVLTGGAVALSAGSSVGQVWPMPDAFWLPLRAAVLCALLVDVSLVVRQRGVSYRVAAALIASLTLLLNLVVFGGFVQALVALMAGVTVLGYGYLAERRWLFALGLLTALAGLVTLTNSALRDFSLGGWNALVLIGIAIIIAGSAIERYGLRLRSAAEQWRERFSGDVLTD